MTAPRPASVPDRYATTAEWEASTLILAVGEEGVDIDTGVRKIGNGQARWVDLPAGAYDRRIFPAGRTGSGVYDPASGLYLPAAVVNPFQTWRKALAKARAGVGQARLAAPGDSIWYGQYATPDAHSAGWVARLKAMLDADLGASGGTGVIWAWTTYAGKAWRVEDARVDWGTGVETSGYGPFAKSMLRYISPGSLTFTPDEQVDAFRIYFVQQDSTKNGASVLSMTVSVDGGADQVIGTGGSTQNLVGVATIDAGSLGNHVLTVRSVSPQAFYIAGVEGVVSDTGVAVSGVGGPGLRASQYNSPSQDGQASWQYVTQGIDPHLTVVGFGHNEYLGQISLASQEADLRTLVSRALDGGSDVLLVTTVPNGDTTKTPSQADVDQVRYAVADDLGVPVLDLATRWGSYADDPALYANTTHPANAGYYDIAAAVHGVISGH